MKKTEFVPIIITGALIVAVLCTLIVHGGWLVWIPTLAALAVVAKLSAKFGR